MLSFSLNRLRIVHFRGFAPDVQLEFNNGKNVFLGMNGTGKTTLLRLVVMAATSNFRELRDEAFHFRYSLTAGQIAIEVDIRNTASPRDTESKARRSRSHMALRDETYHWVYSLAMRHRNRRLGEIDASQSGASLEGIYETRTTLGAHSPFEGDSFLAHALLSIVHVPDAKDIGDQAVAQDIINSALLAMTIHSNLGRFDEALGTYNVLKGAFTEELSAPPPAELRLAMDGGSLYAMTPRFVPQELAQVVLTEVKRTEERTYISITDTNLGFLKRVSSLLGFDIGHVMMHLTQRDTDERGYLKFATLMFGFSDKSKRFLGDQSLSFGQKRLLAFYYYLAANPQMAVIDELVNGFHHAWIEAALLELGDRQSFLTSQNPLLLDQLHFESAEEAQRCFIVSKVRYEDTGHRTMTAENLSIPLARDFFDAYKVGVQHVSYILRTKGLW
jgi:energy-coupling factor transporter ATP-binding protein EcfA2